MKKQLFKEYATPEVNICSVEAEAGFNASLNYGVIDDAKVDDWGTL